MFLFFHFCDNSSSEVRYMKKRNLIACAIILCMVGIGGYYYLQEELSKPENKPIDAQKLKEFSTEGIITEFNDTTIEIKNWKGHTQAFEIKKAIIKDDTELHINDTVSVYYHKEETNSIQTAERITLIKQHNDELSHMISEMTLEEKVGQMVMARCPGGNQAKDDIKNYHLGGYMLFDTDIQGETKETLLQKLQGYQNASDIPMLISTDEEGGTVNRLSWYPEFRGVPFYSPQDLFAEGGLELIKADTKEKAELLQSVGINVNLAPVADVSTDDDDFIYARTFGKAAPQTAEYIKEVIKEAKADGIGTTLKHFPGYGNNVDTHTGIAYDKRSINQFYNADFLPFEAGIEAGADAVLVSHNIVDAFDPDWPSSMSPALHETLREKLHFTGVIMCDDLSMGAIKQFIDYDTSAVQAIKAGNDMILCANYATQIPAVVQAIKNGEIDEVQIDHSVYRILTWKQRLQLISIE